MNEEEGAVIRLDAYPKWAWTSENAESITVANGLLTMSVITDQGVIYIALDNESVRPAHIQTVAAAKQEALQWAQEYMLQKNLSLRERAKS